MQHHDKILGTLSYTSLQKEELVLLCFFTGYGSQARNEKSCGKQSTSQIVVGHMHAHRDTTLDVSFFVEAVSGILNVRFFRV